MPDSSVQKPNNRIHYHIASKTQKIYSPFQPKYYIPPHLNSSGLYLSTHMPVLNQSIMESVKNGTIKIPSIKKTTKINMISMREKYRYFY